MTIVAAPAKEDVGPARFQWIEPIETDYPAECVGADHWRD